MDGRRDVLQRPLRIRGLALFILTISLVDAMPANPGSLKQNIMSGDLVSDSGSLGTSGNVMSAMGNPMQSSGQDPKLTPVRGTKDEQCSDKEMLIMKLAHDLKEAECSIQEELQMLQKALCQSANAEKQSDQLADREVNILMNALSIDHNAMCRAQEMANDCNCQVRSRSKNNKQQRYDWMNRLTQRQSYPTDVGGGNLVDTSSNHHHSGMMPGCDKHDYNDYNLADNTKLM